ncbi:sialidase family protein [Mariniflexile sp.]|uniref:sialidase family protein n=1 Tax=Mariniflexile sp. TaxID=1979402 RepID=UPI0040473A7E
MTTLIFGEQGHVKFDNPLPLSDLAEGVAIRINTDPYNRSYTYDPDLIVLPNGNYIAGEKNRRYVSSDKGATWTQISTSYAIEHASSFYHDGAIYIIGDEAGNNNGRGAINKSTDGGYTWSTPTILLDNFRNSPSHVEIAQDRIWIAYENLPNPHTVNFLSASVNSDLMDANNWVTTTRQDARGTGNETDMVLGRNGWPIAMPKVGPAVRALSAAQAISESNDTFTLPGSGSKYTAKYDPVSDKYWALTSIGDLTATNRVGITLYSSTDLKTWKKEKLVLEGKSSWMHGFNYPSMQFDGDDIIFVLRTAWENERGQAQRWHDADMFTFHRVRNFRDIVPPTASFEQPMGNNRIPVGNDLTVIVNAIDANGTFLRQICT